MKWATIVCAVLVDRRQLCKHRLRLTRLSRWTASTAARAWSLDPTLTVDRRDGDADGTSSNSRVPPELFHPPNLSLESLGPRKDRVKARRLLKHGPSAICPQRQSHVENPT